DTSMRKAVFASSVVLAGILAASSAAADPYASWRKPSSDDETVSIVDSFNRESTSSYSSVYSEDNDKSYRSSVQEDNDVTTTITEDNDITKSWQQSTDVDFQIATPTMSSYKYQDQAAGHQADTSVYGTARGHSVGVEGGTNFVSAGNDETVYYGPALVNTNINQLPQNNLFISGSNGAPIRQDNTFAGRDMGPKGVFAPIGNTSAFVSGDVSNRSGASVGQSGDSANSIADPMSSVIRR
ncbi:MAG: hypothetical protein O6766_06560, partial [Gammaproteobacteria bacterium]|nr:hypothetical protein [Gammaproteobacteria bacterium]